MKIQITRKPAGETDVPNGIRGFSLTELIIALIVVGIMSVIALPYLISYKKTYQSDDQAIKVMDLMREASQLALTRRRVMRFEIDLTDNMILLIDENTATAGASDDKEIKAIPLTAKDEVRFDKIPSGVTKPDPPDYNDAVFADDSLGHKRGSATISGHKVWAARFKSDGSVVNAAGKVFSANLYFWPPFRDQATNPLTTTTPRNKREIRLVTMFGGSGAVRYWKHDGTKFMPY